MHSSTFCITCQEAWGLLVPMQASTLRRCLSRAIYPVIGFLGFACNCDLFTRATSSHACAVCKHGVACSACARTEHPRAQVRA